MTTTPSQHPVTDRLKWYLRRLRAMSPRELAYRLRQRLTTERERFAVARCEEVIADGDLWTGLGFNIPPNWEAWAQRCQTRNMTDNRFGDRDRQAFLSRYPGEVEHLREDAESILKGQLILFGHETIQLGDTFDWHTDVVTGRRWPPHAFYVDVGFRWGGAKSIWEFSRQQYLVTLAQSYWLTKDERFLAGIKQHLSGWLSQNQPYRGIHWTSGLELALRLVSWAWVYFLTKGTNFEPILWREWTRSIVLQGEYLSHHLSRFSSANNHLIGEAFGLLMASILVPEWRSSPRWQKKAVEVLEQEIVKQIRPDGTPAEQAIHYLGFVLDFFLLLHSISQHVNIAVSTSTLSRLDAIGHFIWSLMDVNGNVPAFGDEDGGWAYVLDGHRSNLMESRLAVLAVIGGRSEFKSASRVFDPRSWWLLGERGAHMFMALEGSFGTRNSAAFESGGYWVLRAGAEKQERRLVFDCGPLGYLSLAAHGHADCLSVWLSIGGQPMLVDSGTYKYHEEPEWRWFFRGTAAHNTVRVGGRDQSEQLGATLWGRKAQAKLIDSFVRSDFEWVEGQHDGYLSLSPPVTHRRGVALVGKSYYLVVDWLIGAEQYSVEQFFHFPPGASVTLDEQSNCTVQVGDQTLQVLVLSVLPHKPRLVSGHLQPIQGWVSPKFWQKVPSVTLVYETECGCSEPLITLLWPGAGPGPVWEFKGAADIPGVAHFFVQTAEWRDEFYLALEMPSQPVSIGGKLCQSRIEYVRCHV